MFARVLGVYLEEWGAGGVWGGGFLVLVQEQIQEA